MGPRKRQGERKGSLKGKKKYMNFKSLVWQEIVQIRFALKTFTGLSPGLIIHYFYYFHHALIYKAYGCGTVQA